MLANVYFGIYTVMVWLVPLVLAALAVRALFGIAKATRETAEAQKEQTRLLKEFLASQELRDDE